MRLLTTSYLAYRVSISAWVRFSVILAILQIKNCDWSDRVERGVGIGGKSRARDEKMREGEEGEGGKGGGRVYMYLVTTSVHFLSSLLSACVTSLITTRPSCSATLSPVSPLH